MPAVDTYWQAAFTLPERQFRMRGNTHSQMVVLNRTGRRLTQIIRVNLMRQRQQDTNFGIATPVVPSLPDRPAGDHVH